MKKLFFLILPVLFACGGNKDDNPKPAPTLYDKWHVNSRQTITTQYKGGIVVKKDTLLVQGTSHDYWEFKQSGIHILYDQSGIREAQFSVSGDSIYIQPGVIYPVKVSLYYKFGPGIYGGVGPMLTISNYSMSRSMPGLDSAYFVTTYDFSR